MVEITVGDMEAGKKVHRLLRQLLPGVPLSGIHKMLRTGRVKKNGKKTGPNDTAEQGDVLQLYMSKEDFAEVSKPVRKFGGVSTDIDVVYEDGDILVVNKPAGLLMHGTQEEQKVTLANQVLAYLHRKGMDIRAFAPAPVHRLDRNTSGLVLFAKNGHTARQLSHDLAHHTVRKWYIALVTGQVPVHAVIDEPVIRDPDSNRTRVSPRGKSARTVYHRLAEATGVSVVMIELISGRTHQIRAHFEHIGHPLYEDTKYGGGLSGKGRHQWLHAGWMQLEDGRQFHAQLPPAFRQTIIDAGLSRECVAVVESAEPETYFGG